MTPSERDKFLRPVLEEVLRLLGADAGFVLRRDLRNETVDVLESVGDPPAENEVARLFRKDPSPGTGAGLLAWRAANGDGSLVLAVRGAAPPEGRLSVAIETIARCLGSLAEAERRADASREEYRRLLRRLFDVTEEEQKRISAEIHDQLGARFFDFYYGLRQCQEIVGDLEPSAAAILSDLVEKARICAREVRALTDELRPPALDDFGFAEALAEFLNHLDRDGELAVELSLEPGAPRPAPGTGVALYRIAREAILNARKHACARRLRVSLGRDGRGGLELRIADDGVGFDPAARIPNGHGILCMRERAAVFGGSVRIESAAGTGTTVVVVVPETGGET